MARVLIVEDEAVLRLTFEQFLTEEGYDVSTAANFDEALDCLDKTAVDVVISDIILGGKTGVDLLRTIQERDLGCLVVMITGDPSVETASEAVRLGAFDYLAKPVTEKDIKRIVRIALDRKQLSTELEEYRSELDAIFNCVDAGIVTVDKDLRVRRVNEAARRLFELSPNSVGEERFDRLFPPSMKPLGEALERALQTRKREVDFRLEVSLTGDRNRVLVCSTTPLSAPDDSRDGALLVVRDITRLTFLENELQNRNSYRKTIGKSAKIGEIFRLIEDLSETDSTVLICGESGTGKELIAEAIHESSLRSAGPFIRVNCAALSEDILESELFGHVKGAFTGAIKDRIGRFESANGGTILLDEIGDISPRLQLRLLRVLQEGEFERVGDSKTTQSDARVVASTNQDLLAKIQSGEFRQDLYYRLNVVQIELPALRDRKEDIPLLLEHFSRKFNTRMKKEISGFSPEALNILMNNSWPGNIRELENCIERAFIVCHDMLILPDHLPHEILNGNFLSKPALQAATPHSQNNKLGIDEIRQALAHTDWNIAKSARLLGIARNTLYQKMKALNLVRPDSS